MAAALTLDEVRERLRSPETIKRDAFAILKGIASQINSEDVLPIARDILLRSLEYRELFGDAAVILDSLLRSTGLFPYADTGNLDLKDLLAYELHRPANLDDEVVFHREQSEIYRRLMSGESVILSAPTSFGKSRVVDAIIASRRDIAPPVVESSGGGDLKPTPP